MVVHKHGTLIHLTVNNCFRSRSWKARSTAHRGEDSFFAHIRRRTGQFYAPKLDAQTKSNYSIIYRSQSGTEMTAKYFIYLLSRNKDRTSRKIAITSTRSGKPFVKVCSTVPQLVEWRTDLIAEHGSPDAVPTRKNAVDKLSNRLIGAQMLMASLLAFASDEPRLQRYN
jgi:hypothetical protein